MALYGKILHADEVLLSDGSSIKNADISFIDSFLVVSTDTDNELKPVFYNKNIIQEIRGVITQPKQNRMILM